MTEQTAHTLINPQNGNLAFKIFSFDDGNTFDHIQRLNYYSLIWIKEGSGRAKADFAEYNFSANSLFAFTPYQPFMFMGNDIKGVVINFHPDFFCIHKHQGEVACNGVLFNNIYQPPFISIGPEAADTLHMLIENMRTEMQNPALAQYELLVSYLKIFLITASRLKTQQQAQAMEAVKDLKEPFILQSLKEAIERDFKTKHSASDYASTLNISAKALAKITKTHLHKTLTELIAERIVIEAKRELYLTHKTVKEIAYDLGYEDEYYFSRFFKSNAEVSPQLYRETVGFGRAMA
ncbi:MAG: helix-turn-helix domain-containing protein [Chitinophagales bacterium]|nr:helix-turn-helix domain-containing protein [Chitinophagales bacterium]